MKRSIATVSLSGTLGEKLAAVAKAGFDAVEIFENDLIYSALSPRAIRDMAADHGLEIALYQPFRDFEAVPEAQFRRNLDRAERKFDVMGELGAATILVCSNVSPLAVDDDALAAAQLHALAERAKPRAIRVGYEALAWGAHVNRYGHVRAIVESAAHPNLGMVLDSFHTLAVGDDVAAIRDIPGDLIFFVQLADAPRKTLDPLSWSRHYRCFPGQGDLDVAGFLRAALDAGYDGPLSLEIFNDEFRAAPPGQTADDGMRSLKFLEEQVGLAPAPPRAPRLSGYAFLEFALDASDGGDQSAAELGALLEMLGFRPVGRHRTKDVTLYRQGEAVFILNAERDSFAHSYYLFHGPSICAIGLTTADASQSLDRAVAYGGQRFEGRIGPNELAIPAIRSLDGSLLYFLKPDSGFQDVDFAPIDHQGVHADAGLIAVDHVAQALPENMGDSFVLFYRAVLGLEPEAVFVLADPYGVVRSRALASPGGAVRFPLNISASRNTATGRSVSTFAGAGVHHIALTTQDIFASVAIMRANRVPLLPIPASYYDDLAARYDLPEATLERLRHHDVLYDRIEGPEGVGEFLHVYTEAFQDRFFFEVVQRLNGYDSYGAVNAGVRMAVQAQLRAEAAAALAEVDL